MKRRATHAGSWYSGKGSELASELSCWLDEAEATCGPARAIIAPHAGFSYSGPTAAVAYKHMKPAVVRRVFILGPSHSAYLPQCAVTRCDAYKTPLGDLTIDKEVRDELLQTGAFDEMQLGVDEKEHSIELHLPFIAQVMGDRPFTIVPILVGALSEQSEVQYGEIFAPYLARPENFFVVSSDFCHWGKRFRFTHFDQRHGEIFQSIEALDRQGMGLIEAQDACGFCDYQRQYGNTICGQHPISVLLRALRCIDKKHTVKFVRYAQSSRCRTPDDSSVSYASAVICDMGS